MATTCLIHLDAKLGSTQNLDRRLATHREARVPGCWPRPTGWASATRRSHLARRPRGRAPDQAPAQRPTLLPDLHGGDVVNRRDIALLVVAILITLVFTFWSGTLACT